ncbi:MULTISPECIES: small secreted protein [Streptomyces]|uniref:Small secreted protein n=1 Tax=Streptomyces cacaoi TaxID=1898 RepID=A0A4Y3QY03_STRCI|nr:MULTISPECIES: small secreted protein [Streptomyces]GEB50295.1 hypothetical protein SCA03_28460 [Streptomyces cacaoi]
MNKKLVAALSGSAALVLALTGCSDDSGEKADAWAKQVCDKVRPEVQKIQKANASIDEASPQTHSRADVKKTDSAAFQQVSAAYGSLANSIDKAGDPPVDGGAKIRKDAVKELRSLSSQYKGLKTKIDSLSTADNDKAKAQFSKGLEDVASQIKTLGESGNKALENLQKGDLGEAVANQEDCRKKPGAKKS